MTTQSVENYLANGGKITRVDIKDGHTVHSFNGKVKKNLTDKDHARMRKERNKYNLWHKPQYTLNER